MFEERQLLPRAGNIPLSQGLQGREKERPPLGREGHERGVRARRRINRNNRSIWMLPKREKKTGILFVRCVQVPFSRRKKTFLMFFGISQAISLRPDLPISSFSALQKRRITKHRSPHRHPALTYDYTEKYQTPSMPCTAEWCAGLMRSGDPPHH